MEKKGVENYLCYAIAALAWGGTVWLLWFFQERVYDGIIKTDWWRWIIFPGAMLLGFCMQSESREERRQRAERWPEWRRQLGRILFDLMAMLFSMVLIWQLLAQTLYELPAYYGLAMFAMVGLLSIFPQAGAWFESGGMGKGVARSLTAVFSLGAVVTLLYFAIARPATVGVGQRLVEDAGYGEVFYARPIEHGALLDYIFPGSYEKMTEEEYRQGYYLFQGKRDGQDWGVAVSLYRPHIVEQERLADNSELKRFVSQREIQSRRE